MGRFQRGGVADFDSTCPHRCRTAVSQRALMVVALAPARDERS